MAKNGSVEDEEELEMERNPLRNPTSVSQHVNIESEESSGVCDCVLIIMGVLLYIIFLPISIFTSFRIIKTYERAVILRLGRLKRTNGRAVLGAGVQFVLPCTDNLLRVDLRTKSVDIPPQELLTRDSVTIRVDAVVYMRVIEPTAALLKIENAFKSTELLAVSFLRNVLGSYELSRVLTSREEMNSKLQQLLDEATDPWGIKVERVEITDVSLPKDMQRAMAAEAQATREARAKVIAAQGELDASDTLHSAALKLEGSPVAIQLRYLQALTTIATERNSTIVFPLPIDLLGSLAKKYL